MAEQASKWRDCKGDNDAMRLKKKTVEAQIRLDTKTGHARSSDDILYRSGRRRRRVGSCRRGELVQTAWAVDVINGAVQLMASVAGVSPFPSIKPKCRRMVGAASNRHTRHLRDWRTQDILMQESL
jgi:hypothetical protein